MIVSCVMVLCTYTIVGITAQSGYQYYQEIDSWLKLHHAAATWEFAMNKCLVEGGVLASPTNVEMLAIMKRVMESAVWPGVFGIFIGIHSTFTDDEYYSIDGTPFNQLPLPGISEKVLQSVNPKTHKYMAFHVDTSFTGAGEQDTFPFICQRKKNTSCDTHDSAYVFNSRTGSCYKFHKFGKTWHEAAKTCSIEGGYLAIINSKIEARALNDLFLKNPPHVIVSDIQNTTSLGFLDWKGQGIWTTIHGLPLKYSGYMSWASGQPDGSRHPVDGASQKCGGMVRGTKDSHGLFDDVWCDVELAFICERRLVYTDIKKAGTKN